MTPPEVNELIDQYRTGLEAELALLRRLAVLADRQRHAADARDFATLASESDERDRVMNALAAIEAEMAHIRRLLDADRPQAERHAYWPAVVRLRTDASAIATAIMAVDQTSLKLLADSELVRRATLAGLEKGETTLAAYRRVLAPPIAHAALVDTRG